MSASNDAINQANEVRLNHPPPPPKEIRESRPARTQQEESPVAGLPLPSFVYLALLVSFLLLGIVFLRLVNHRIQVHAATPPASTTAVTTPVHRPAARSSTAAATTDPGATMIVAPPAPPPLRLQAVFFSPTKPSAIVSGSTVYIGDKLREFHVTAIGRDSVTLAGPTETKVLKMY